MSILDLVLVAVFVYAGFSGYKRGLIVQAAGLAGLIVGIWGAIHFSDFTASFLIDTFSLNSEYLPLIAFAITFAGIVIGVHFLGIVVESICNLAFLGLANRILGVVFGVLKTAMILSVVLLLLGKVSDRVKIIPDNFGENSLFYGPIERLAPSIFPYLNFEDIKGVIGENFMPKQTSEKE